MFVNNSSTFGQLVDKLAYADMALVLGIVSSDHFWCTETQQLMMGLSSYNGNLSTGSIPSAFDQALWARA